MFDKSRPLKVVTLCSGYDSQCMALERLKERHPEFEYDLIAWSEIDKYAIRAHDAVFPQYAGRNLGDMTKIDWSKVPNFDFLTYSTPCTDLSNAGLQKGMEEGSGTRSSILWYTRKRWRIGDGLPLYMIVYGLGRVWIEGLRSDSLYIPGTSLRISQLLSGLMVLGGAAYFLIRRQKRMAS